MSDASHSLLPRAPDPWNKGRLIGQKRPLKPKDVWTIRVRLELEHSKRDLAMFDLAIDSKLRSCDLVRLQINDVCAGGRVRDRATVIQKKTGRPVQFEITEPTRAAAADCCPASVPLAATATFSRAASGSSRTFPRDSMPASSIGGSNGLVSTVLPWHPLHAAHEAGPDLYIIYKKTGNLRAVQLLLGHTKLDYLPRRTMSRCGQLS